MNKGAIVLAILSMLGTGAYANPDEAGYLRLFGGLQVANYLQRETTTGVYGTSTKEYRTIGSNVLGVQARAGVLEWASLDADLVLTGSSYHQVRSDAATVEYVDDLQSKGYSIGATFFPSAFGPGPFTPGIDNPDGKNFWPSIGIRYWHRSESDRRSYSRIGEYVFDTHGYAVEAIIPVTKWLSVGGSEELMESPWEPGVSAYVGGFYQVWATLFLSLKVDDPERVDDYFPRIGKPGQLRVDLGWGHSDDQPVSRSMSGQAFLRSAYAWNHLLAFDLGYQLTVPSQPSADVHAWWGSTIEEQNGFDQSVVLGIRLNYAALPWAGRPGKFEPDAVPVNVKTDAPADVPEEPKEAPTP